jgi:hypothetical protein
MVSGCSAGSIAAVNLHEAAMLAEASAKKARLHAMWNIVAVILAVGEGRMRK